MAEGQLRCVGSSLFLKKTYGVGYQLTIETRKAGERNSNSGENQSSHLDNPQDCETDAEGQDKDGERLYPVLSKDFAQKEQTGSSDGVEAVEQVDEVLVSIVKSAVSSATLLTNVGSELSFQLPVGAASDFGPMFEGLDREIDCGGITSYGVSITTLDEVFLLVARGGAEKKDFISQREQGKSSKPVEIDRSSRSQMNLEQDGLFSRHLGALFMKRAAFFRRDKKA